MSDLARHVQGVPDEDGLLQAILPAQEKFRVAIRETAPNFRPFEKRFEGKRHMGRVTFLAAEEGRTFDDEDSEDENCPREEPDSEIQEVSTGRGLAASSYPTSKKSKIFIDQVLQRANRQVLGLPPITPFFEANMSTILLQCQNSGTTRPLSVCCSENHHRRNHQRVEGSCSSPLQIRLRIYVRTYEETDRETFLAFRTRIP